MVDFPAGTPLYFTEYVEQMAREKARLERVVAEVETIQNNLSYRLVHIRQQLQRALNRV